MIPDNINKMPQNRWLFFQTTTFFMLHVVRRPIMEFRFSFGMIFPRMMRAIPRTPNEIFVRENGTSFRFSTWWKSKVKISNTMILKIPATKVIVLLFFSLPLPFFSCSAAPRAAIYIKNPKNSVIIGKIKVSDLFPQRVTWLFIP